MEVLFLLLLILGALCFLVAALGHTLRNLNLIALGLFFWILVPVIEALEAVH